MISIRAPEKKFRLNSRAPEEDRPIPLENIDIDHKDIFLRRGALQAIASEAQSRPDLFTEGVWLTSVCVRAFPAEISYFNVD